MSSKAHFIYEDGIEGFEETNEPQSIFGKFTGFNAYLIIELRLIKSFKIKDEHIYIEVKNTDHLPKNFKIWGGDILEVDIDSDGLLIALKGGTHGTKKIINRNFEAI